MENPRLSLALLIAMDFLIATVIVMFTHYALDFVTQPFGGILRAWVYVR